MTTSQQPRLPHYRQTIPRVHTHHRHQFTELTPPQERITVEPSDATGVGITRTSTSAFGGGTTGRHRSSSSKSRSFFRWFWCPCVPAAPNGRTTSRRTAHHGLELVAIHRSNATHQTVGRSVLNEVIKFAPLSLGGEHKRGVLNKGTLVDEIFDIFTPVRCPRSLRRSTAVGEPHQGRRVPLDHL